MKMPAEIERAIEMLYMAHRVTGGPWVKDFAEALAYIVAEDCAAVADDTETVEVRGYDAQLGDAEATKDKIIEAIRQRYGLDEQKEGPQ